MFRLRTARDYALLAGAAVLATSLVAPPSAQASGYPAPPTGLHVTAVSHTGFTVTIQRSANARSYRLLVSTVKSDLYWKNLDRASSARHSFTSTSTRLTASGLTYRTVPYFYRVEAIDGRQLSISPVIGELGLRPATPSGVHVSTGTSGTYLTWSSGTATGFRIERADNQAMTLHLHTDRIAGTLRQFTPYGLTRGHTYYFRVRAVNLTTASRPSAAVAAAPRTHSQSVLVMSYNILMLTADGTSEAGGVIAPWSNRRVAAASLIKSVSPDVIGVQEGQAMVDGVRQVDSLVSALQGIGAHYDIAETESGRVHTGNYLLYDPSVYVPDGPGGHWSLGYDSITAAYQVLKNVNTGARCLFVTTHLTHSSGLSWDRIRESETESMVRQASDLAASGGVPVVYTGDYNSNSDPKYHPLDGSGVVMRAAAVSDARLVAQSVTRGKYDSMNEYRRVPPAHYFDIDYVWAPPGVAAHSYGTALDLSSGRFVGTIPSDHNPVYSRVSFPY